LYAEGIAPDLSYSDDYAFLSEMRLALEQVGDERMSWIASNVVDVANPQRYVDHLGAERIERLHIAWRAPAGATGDIAPAAPTRTETMILAAAQVIADVVRASKPRFVFAGIGASSLAAWMAHATSVEFPPLVSEMGFYDYAPALGDSWLFTTANMERCAILNDTEVILGSLVHGHGDAGLGVLATAQVDGSGRLNTTVANGRFITGSGGANDVMSGVAKVVVVAPHDASRLVQKVDYHTSPGLHTAAVVTDRAVFLRRNGGFELDAVLAPTSNLDDAVREVLAATPWDVTVAEGVRAVDPVEESSLRTLRSFDPERHFLGAAERARVPAAD
jgi:acyl CoA:acetate/3-ketoacid CoA transferase beta subunit